MCRIRQSAAHKVEAKEDKSQEYLDLPAVEPHFFLCIDLVKHPVHGREVVGVDEENALRLLGEGKGEAVCAIDSTLPDFTQKHPDDTAFLVPPGVKNWYQESKAAAAAVSRATARWYEKDGGF